MVLANLANLTFLGLSLLIIHRVDLVDGCAVFKLIRILLGATGCFRFGVEGTDVV